MKDINLLPEEIRVTSSSYEGNVKNKHRISSITLGISIFVILLMAFSIAAPKMYSIELDNIIQTLDNQLKAEKYTEVRTMNTSIASTANQITIKKNLIDYISKESYPVSGILHSLSQAVPKGCVINALEYDTETLKLTGFTSEGIKEAEFISHMYKLGFFNSKLDENDVKLERGKLFEYSFKVGRKDGK